jgi:hypothetical protein
MPLSPLPSVEEDSLASTCEVQIEPPTMQLQPEIRPITQEQLVDEMKGIYDGPVMVEKNPFEIDHPQAPMASKLRNQEWEALVALHRTILHENGYIVPFSEHHSHQSQSGVPTMVKSPDSRNLIKQYVNLLEQCWNVIGRESLRHALNLVRESWSSCEPSLFKIFKISLQQSKISLQQFNISREQSKNLLEHPWNLLEHPWNLLEQSKNLLEQSKNLLEQSKNLLKQSREARWSARRKPVRPGGLAVSDTVPKGGLRMQRLKRFLPMFLDGSRYDTTPDTGSLENAISADETRRLGLKITAKGRQFLMGNGSMAISLGIVRIKCAFALGEPCVTWQSFNVIDNLAVPVIIGKAFLDLSKTMTLHQHRLEAVWTSAKKAFRVMHLNRPRQLVRCYVNGKLVHANPDTGSEVDLMSPFYARKNALKIEALEEGEDWVQLADGSTAKLLGKTQVDLDIHDGRYRSPTGYICQSRTFYLLDGLSTDVLLGDEALCEMHVFTEHEDSFVESNGCGLPIEMNLITWFDKRARQMSDTLAALSSVTAKQSKSLHCRDGVPCSGATLDSLAVPSCLLFRSDTFRSTRTAEQTSCSRAAPARTRNPETRRTASCRASGPRETRTSTPSCI